MRLSKTFLWAITALAALVGLSAVYLYFWWWIPHQKLCDYKWVTTASTNELLQTSLQLLRVPNFPSDNQDIANSDAISLVCTLSGPESVPLLIHVLRRFSDDYDGFMVDTKASVLATLRNRTGYDAGDNYKDWATWWKKIGRHIAPQTITFPATVTSVCITNRSSSYQSRLLRINCMTDDGHSNTFHLSFREGYYAMYYRKFPIIPKLKVGDTCLVTVASLWLGGRPKVTPEGGLCGQLIRIDQMQNNKLESEPAMTSPSLPR